jgi:hypothetical protein
VAVGQRIADEELDFNRIRAWIFEAAARERALPSMPRTRRTARADSWSSILNEYWANTGQIQKYKEKCIPGPALGTPEDGRGERRVRIFTTLGGACVPSKALPVMGC